MTHVALHVRALRLVVNSALRADRRRALAVFAGSILAYGMASSLALWLKLITDGALHRAWVLTIAGVVGFGLAIGLQVVLMGAVELLAQDVSERTQLVLDERLLQDVSALPGIAQHEDPAFADRVTMLLNGAGASAAGGLIRAAGMLAVTVVTLALLADVHPALLLVVVASLPPLLCAAIAERSVHAAALHRAEHDRREEQLFSLLTTAQSMQEIQIAGVAGALEARRSRAWSLSSHTAASADLRALVWNGLGTLLFAGSYAACIGFMLQRALDGKASPGDVLLVLVLAFQASTLLSMAVGALAGAAESLRLAREQIWIHDYVRTMTPPQSSASTAAPDRIMGGLAVEHLSFQYPGSQRPAIADLTMTLPAGSVVALVGENGAGKTTLTKLLCRLYEPTDGAIRVDGVDIAEYAPDAWRTGLSGIFQDFARFEFTAQQTVGCGHLPSVDDPGAVMTAARRADAADIVDGLAERLSTQLGRTWPGGVDLSTGQWQRLAAARMAMRPQPVLVLMDEPTSNLDPQAEHEFMARCLAEARSWAAERGTITLITSHRLLSVRGADHIVMLDNGRLIEAGCHEELMERRGMYRELFEIQSRAYR
jgi:ATP-binding cassette subfamily B protein